MVRQGRWRFFIKGVTCASVTHRSLAGTFRPVHKSTGEAPVKDGAVSRIMAAPVPKEPRYFTLRFPASLTTLLNIICSTVRSPLPARCLIQASLIPAAQLISGMNRQLLKKRIRCASPLPTQEGMQHVDFTIVMRQPLDDSLPGQPDNLLPDPASGHCPLFRYHKQSGRTAYRPDKYQLHAVAPPSRKYPDTAGDGWCANA